MPGMPFPGDPDRYPGREEVADYLERYAATIPVEIQTNTRVVTVREDNGGFVAVTTDGRDLDVAGIIAGQRIVLEPLSVGVTRGRQLHRPEVSTFESAPLAFVN